MSDEKIDVLAVLRRDATDAARLRGQQDSEYAGRRAAESVLAIAAVIDVIDAATDALKYAGPEYETLRAALEGVRSS